MTADGGRLGLRAIAFAGMARAYKGRLVHRP